MAYISVYNVELLMDGSGGGFDFFYNDLFTVYDSDSYVVQESYYWGYHVQAWGNFAGDNIRITDLVLSDYYYSPIIEILNINLTEANLYQNPMTVLAAQLTGNDQILGDWLNDFIWGHGGDDTLMGFGGSDTILGDAGADRIHAHNGDDAVHAGSGNDVVYGNQGIDVILGAQGDDTLYGGQGADGLFDGVGTDLIYGNLHTDLVQAGTGNDTIYGGQGDDTLMGQAGNDIIYGNRDADAIWGNLGNDLLFGGPGGDRFLFAAGNGADVIIDFVGADGDRIVDGAARAYTVSHFAGGAKVDFSDGDSITIYAAGGFSADWILNA